MTINAVTRTVGVVASVRPICADPDCLMCAITRSPDETRDAFTARIKALYQSGRLFSTRSMPGGSHGS